MKTRREISIPGRNQLLLLKICVVAIEPLDTITDELGVVGELVVGAVSLSCPAKLRCSVTGHSSTCFKHF